MTSTSKARTWSSRRSSCASAAIAASRAAGTARGDSSALRRRLKIRFRQLPLLVLGEHRFHVDEEQHFVAVRDHGDEQLAADALDQRRRRKELIAGYGDDAAHFVHFQ